MIRCKLSVSINIFSATTMILLNSLVYQNNTSAQGNIYKSTVLDVKTMLVWLALGGQTQNLSNQPQCVETWSNVNLSRNFFNSFYFSTVEVVVGQVSVPLPREPPKYHNYFLPLCFSLLVYYSVVPVMGNCREFVTTSLHYIPTQ